MTAKEILASINGFSTPIFGIQWNPPTLDITIAKDTILLLENKRVLFNPTHMENDSHCLSSVVDIRNELTNQLKRLIDKTGYLSKELKSMRNASMKFCDNISTNLYNNSDQVIKTSILERELFNLREKFGTSLAKISISYGIDIDDDLAKILPFRNN